MAALIVFGGGYWLLVRNIAFKKQLLSIVNGGNQAITGTGLVLVLVLLLHGLLVNTSHAYFLFAFAMLALVNWLDDLFEIHSGWRLITQFLALSFLVMEFGLISSYWSPFFLVVAVGVVNAYNFMDGINGISGIYALAVLAPLPFAYAFDTENMGRLLLIFLFLILFILFNFRRSAKAILGDTGSIALGFLVLFYSLQCFKNYDIYLLMSFSMLFLLDTGYTLLERTYRRKNVFQSHREHLYQMLVHRRGWDPRWVAMGYGVIQLGINITLLLLKSSRSQLLFSIAIGAILSGVYWYWKTSIKGATQVDRVRSI